VGGAVTQILAGAAIDGVAQGRGGKVLFTEPPILAPVVVPLLITTTPFVMEATADVHRVYALALAAPAAVAIVKLPADPVDGAIVTLKGDFDDLDSTPITVSAVGGEAIDAGGFTSYSMPRGPIGGGEHASQAKTFVYYDALGEWRVTWSDPGQKIPSP